MGGCIPHFAGKLPQLYARVGVCVCVCDHNTYSTNIHELNKQLQVFIVQMKSDKVVCLLVGVMTAFSVVSFDYRDVHYRQFAKYHIFCQLAKVSNLCECPSAFRYRIPFITMFNVRRSVLLFPRNAQARQADRLELRVSCVYVKNQRANI